MSKIKMSGNCIAVLSNIKTGSKELFFAENLVTNGGDQYYAEGGVGSPSVAMQGMHLGSDPASGDVAKGDTDVNSYLASKAIDATYPQTSDGDTDNTSGAVDTVTWRVSFTAGEANVNSISEVAVVNSIGDGNPTAAICHAVFGTPFSKTSDDTLKVFINHNFLGS